VSYRWIEHTGEVELALDGDARADVFADALAALRELLDEDGEASAETVEAEIELEAPDQAALLADWLEELLFLAETTGLLPARATRLEVDERHLGATVAGHRGRPSGLVKGVTYHGLRLDCDDGHWTATVVLDV
jgi:SHS2 domain-containing protein